MSTLNFRSLPDFAVWSKEKIEQTQEQFSKIATIQDYKDFIRYGDRRLISQIMSLFPVQYSKIDHPINVDGFDFAKIAEIDRQFALDTKQKVLKLYSNLDVNNANYNCTVVRELSPEEEELRKKYNLDKRPHTIEVDEQNFPELVELSKKAKLNNPVNQILFAPSGSVHAVHVDALERLWSDDKADNQFNHFTKCPDGEYIVRILIALNDWTPGQVVGFEDRLWTYKAGDAITFDWANNKHYTSNASWSPRMVFRITGTTSDPNHWVFNNINSGNVTNLSD